MSTGWNTLVCVFEICCVLPKRCIVLSVIRSGELFSACALEASMPRHLTREQPVFEPIDSPLVVCSRRYITAWARIIATPPVGFGARLSRLPPPASPAPGFFSSAVKRDSRLCCSHTNSPLQGVVTVRPAGFPCGFAGDYATARTRPIMTTRPQTRSSQ